MMRLTVRSTTGKLLARLVDVNGEVTVTDWGDPAFCHDAAVRASTGGFTVRWNGEDEVASVGDPALLRWLALHFATRGLLVSVDEPGVVRGELPVEPRFDTIAEPTELVSAASRARHLARVPPLPLLRSDTVSTTPTTEATGRHRHEP
jgi:hypothetical protein